MLKRHPEEIFHWPLPAGSPAEEKCPCHFCYCCYHCYGVKASCSRLLSCLALLLTKTWVPWRVQKTWGDKTEAMADCSATQPVPPLSPPGSASAGTLLLNRVSADLTSQPTSMMMMMTLKWILLPLATLPQSYLLQTAMWDSCQFTKFNTLWGTGALQSLHQPTHIEGLLPYLRPSHWPPNHISAPLGTPDGQQKGISLLSAPVSPGLPLMVLKLPPRHLALGTVANSFPVHLQVHLWLWDLQLPWMVGWWELCGQYVGSRPLSFTGIHCINFRDRLGRAHSTASLSHFVCITGDGPGPARLLQLEEHIPSQCLDILPIPP